MAAPVLIVGGTGKVGQSVVYELLAREIPVRALVRDPDRAALLPEAVEVVVADLGDAESLAAALAGVERAFLLTGAEEDLAAAQIAFIDAAKAAGILRIVNVSTVGAARDAGTHLAKWHGEVEEHLKGSGVGFTILQPSYYMQNLIGNAAQIAEGALVALAGDGKIAIVDTRDVADVAVVALTDDGYAGRTVVITGPEALTHTELAAKLTAASGHEVEYVDADAAEAREAMIGAGMPQWFVDDLLALNQQMKDGKLAAIRDTSAILGRPGRTFDQFAADYADLFVPVPSEEPAVE